jgi:PH/SEC7 domain-containing protein
MDALNTAASLLSSPPLAAPCGSQQRFQRPLLPASLTKMSAREQLSDHEERVAQLEQDLHEHRANPPSSKAKSVIVDNYKEKDAYLHFEVLLDFVKRRKWFEPQFFFSLLCNRKPVTRLT